MAKIYNQKINLALNEELIDKIQDAELKKFFSHINLMLQNKI